MPDTSSTPPRASRSGRTAPAPATVCVTGATGFLGARLVEALLAEGHRVRATYRDRSRLAALEGLEVEPVRADILDRATMRRALKGCDACFHAAAIVGSNPPDRVYEVNARAPRVVVEAAAAQGVGRVILVSSVAGIGLAPRGQVADEELIFRSAGLKLTYANSKHEGEGTALAAAAQTGVELVITNPSYVLGPAFNRGLRGESSTRVVGNYLRGRLAAVVDGNCNIVDVADVAQGHLLAWHKGRPGQRYILAGQNTRWSKVMETVAEVSGIHRPLVLIPPAAEPVARTARALGWPTPISFEAIELMSQNWHYSSAKAERELGYRHRPADQTIRRTVEWYLELIEAGRFEGRDLSAMRLMAAGVQAADRAGGAALARGARPLIRLLNGKAR